MKVFKFESESDLGYKCDQPGDNSGEYVKKEVALNLVEVLYQVNGKLEKVEECLRELTESF